MTDSEYILAEFKGTYRAPEPNGQRDLNVTKPFHVAVKMDRSVLTDDRVLGLKGLFATYYREFVRRAYPDMIDLYFFDLVQATELDGTVIENPKALSFDNLIAYIQKKRYPINTTLYAPAELRNEVLLYERDKDGQQHLESLRTKMRGSELAVAAKLQNLDDVLVVLTPSSASADSLEDLLAPAGRAKKK
ncbi:MAG: hypothetical protein K2Y32_00265 [Candidatus Obscuribacterales bacterium]|nr:hypothetical protein [Candidatus Obscuribacterales bacterium]